MGQMYGIYEAGTDVFSGWSRACHECGVNPFHTVERVSRRGYYTASGPLPCVGGGGGTRVTAEEEKDDCSWVSAPCS